MTYKDYIIEIQAIKPDHVNEVARKLSIIHCRKLREWSDNILKNGDYSANHDLTLNDALRAIYLCENHLEKDLKEKCNCGCKCSCYICAPENEEELTP